MGMLDLFMPGASQYLTPDQQDSAANLGLLNASLGLIDASSNQYGLPKSPFQLGAAAVRGYGTGTSAYTDELAKAYATQTAQMNVQLQQAIQPMVLNQIKSMSGGAGATPMMTGGAVGGGPAANNAGFVSGAANPSPMNAADQYGAQMLISAWSSGDMKAVSEAYKSLYEHNPALAGAIMNAQQQNSYQKTPQGTYVMPGQNAQTNNPSPLASFYAPPPALPTPVNPTQAPSPAAVGTSAMQQGAPAIPPPDPGIQLSGPASAALPTPPPSQMPPQRDFAAMPPEPAAPMPQAAPNPVKQFTASDGKPFVPQAMNASIAPSDPAGTPKYNTENTETGVNQTKLFQADDIKADGEMAANIQNTNQMLARLKDIAGAYSQAKSGTALSLNPELANQAIALGIIKDPADIKNVAQYQRVLSDLSIETINQIKQANAGSGSQRIMATELESIMGKMADPKLQPQAVKDILALSQGLGNYGQDMVKGWETIGGLGNRIAGGFTLRPSQYQQQFSLNHNLSEYVNQAKQGLDIKGTQSATPSNVPQFSSPTDEAFAKLPKGSKFLDENGTLRVKH